MTSDAISIVRLIFSTIWSLFTSWYIPGTNVTPGLLFVFFLVAVFALRTLKKFFNGEDDES